MCASDTIKVECCAHICWHQRTTLTPVPITPVCFLKFNLRPQLVKRWPAVEIWNSWVWRGYHADILFCHYVHALIELSYWRTVVLMYSLQFFIANQDAKYTIIKQDLASSHLHPYILPSSCQLCSRVFKTLKLQAEQSRCQDRIRYSAGVTPRLQAARWWVSLISCSVECMCRWVLVLFL